MKNVTKQFIVKTSDLPLFCNGSALTLTNNRLQESINLHPKVYLELSNNKITNCPYCGSQYILTTEINYEKK